MREDAIGGNLLRLREREMPRFSKSFSRSYQRGFQRFGGNPLKYAEHLMISGDTSDNLATTYDHLVISCDSLKSFQSADSLVELGQKLETSQNFRCIDLLLSSVLAVV